MSHKSKSSNRYYIEPFDGSNFPTWETEVKCALLSEDIYETVIKDNPITLRATIISKDGADKKEIITETINMLDMHNPKEPEEVGDYRADMRKAYGIILSSIDNAHKRAVQAMKSPKEIWDYMHKTYQANTVISRATILRNLFRTDMREGTSLEAHFAKFDESISDAARAGMNLGDEENLAMALLMSLPPSFEHVVTALKTQTIAPSVKTPYNKSKPPYHRVNHSKRLALKREHSEPLLCVHIVNVTNIYPRIAGNFIQNLFRRGSNSNGQRRR